MGSLASAIPDLRTGKVVNEGEVLMEKSKYPLQPWLLLALSVGLCAILLPFWGSILWAVIAAILFAPLYQRLLARYPRWPGLCALAVTLGILLLFILPALGLAGALVDQLVDVYHLVQAQKFDLGTLSKWQARLPAWVNDWIGTNTMPDIAVLKERLSSGAMATFRGFLKRALSAGQDAFSLFLSIGMMLYLAFFLIRDGAGLAQSVGDKIPLEPALRTKLAASFIGVIRATIKGGMVVALVQGTLGGLIFWALGLPAPLLMGVVMGIFSLLPAVGSGLVWVPGAAYLLITGQVWQGVVLILVGIFVIGMVDNLLRPVLVGKETGLPDYIVLFSTLGGIALLGFNGLLIGPAIAALFMVSWNHVSLPVGRGKKA
jgi:predicted PurR-regulated permease PerM